jgi:hypothetical protein
MEQLTDSLQADRYGGFPLGVESAWPGSQGAPTLRDSLDSSSSPQRGPGIGRAFSLRFLRSPLAAAG